MLSISVWKKMEIIHEYERLKKLGTIKNVGAFMRKNGKLKGGYQGCLSKTKWLGSREKYKVGIYFASTHPNLQNKYMKFPMHCLMFSVWRHIAEKKHEYLFNMCIYIYVFSLYRTIMYFLVTGIHCVLKQYIYICMCIYICKRYLWNWCKNQQIEYSITLRERSTATESFQTMALLTAIPSPLAKAFESCDSSTTNAGRRK